MIKQILFDCGGVFVDVRYRELFEEITGDPAFAADIMQRFWAEGSPWHLYDRGDYKKSEISGLMREFLPDIPMEVLMPFWKNGPMPCPSSPRWPILLIGFIKQAINAIFSPIFRSSLMILPPTAHPWKRWMALPSPQKWE